MDTHQVVDLLPVLWSLVEVSSSNLHGDVSNAPPPLSIVIPNVYFPQIKSFKEIKGFPCGSAGKESACNVGDLVSIPGLGASPGEGKGYPLQYSGELDRIVQLETNLRPQWGLKELDPAERLSLDLNG